jgi:hypothetical protein
MKRLPRLVPRDWIGLTIALVGFILRARQYLANRSLWLDEAMLTNNILGRGFGGLFQQLDNNQGAPIGFLLLQKFLTLILGTSEYALRLLPLLAGLVSLTLMFLLMRKVAKPIAGLIALALFAVSPPLVYYASEVKQYSSDVAIALGLTLLYLFASQGLLRRRSAPPRNDGNEEFTNKDAILLAFAGALAMWFSHPAVFVVAALGLALFIPALRARDKKQILLLLSVGGAWILSLVILYLVNLRQLSTHQFFLDYWAVGFMPRDASAFAWFAASLDGPFRDLLGLQTSYVVTAILFLIGLIALTRRNPSLGIFLLSTLFFSLLASFLTLYPFAGRMILFLAPFLVLSLAEGTEAVAGLFSRSAVAAWIIRGILIVYLFYGPLDTSAENFLAPKYQEHIRPTLEYLRDYRKPGDIIYVYYWAEHAVRYYAPKYGMDMSAFTIGADHHEARILYFDDLNALRGNERVWFLFSHVYESGDFNERNFILGILDSIGEKLREFREPGTSVYLYLYDLR